jgi:hypothetical protein
MMKDSPVRPVRIAIAGALLGLVASCAWPPPPDTAAPPPMAGPVALMPAPAAPAPATSSEIRAALGAPTPTPVALAPAPPPAVAAPGTPTLDYVPAPLVWLGLLNEPRPPGRFTLSNFSFPSTRVQAVITSGPDCVAREGSQTADFMLPLNGTRIITTPPDADVCWRLALPPAAAQGGPPTPPWSEWNRAYTSSGRFFDSRM